MAELNDKQKRFCEEYLIDLNATQAAIRAGYSEKTARAIGAENLTKPDIQEYLTNLRLELQDETKITPEKVLKEYAKIAFLDIRRFYNVDGAMKSIHDLDDESAGALAGVETYEEKPMQGVEDAEQITIGQTKKIKTYDKVKALDSLARHLGMFEKDNNQQKTTVNVTGLSTPDLRKLEALLSQSNGH